MNKSSATNQNITIWPLRDSKDYIRYFQTYKKIGILNKKDSCPRRN